MNTYTFTFEQLVVFLENYCGCTLDASGKESLEKLLDEVNCTKTTVPNPNKNED